MINYYVLYFLLFYNILSIFVNGNPPQETGLPQLKISLLLHKKRPADKSAGLDISTLYRGYLLFGTALPQQLLHLGKLVIGDILPLQQCREQAYDFRLIGMGIDRSGKVLFSCERR